MEATKERAESGARDGINRTTLIFGRTGQGKTTLAKGIVRGARRLIIIDTVGEYEERVIVGQAYDLLTYLVACSRKPNPKFRVSFRPGWLGESLVTPGSFYGRWKQVDKNRQLGLACHAAWVIGDCDLLVEEIDAYCGGSYLVPQLESIVRYGRHRRVRLIAVVRRSYSMPILIRSQAKEVYTFQQVEPRDIDYMVNWLGDEKAALIRSLPDHHYLHLTI